MRNVCFFVFICFSINFAVSQKITIGDWAMHLNYTNINAISQAGSNIYVGTKSGLFLYDHSDNSLVSFSKLDGLSSLNITALKYSDENGLLMVGYNDGNIDILQNNQVINIPYIEMANILSEKTINHIFIDDNLAYVSCSFGLVVIDIARIEVKETYYFSDGGNNFSVFETYVFNNDINTASDAFLANKIFVGTSNGLFYADKNSNLLNYEVWTNDSRLILNKGNNTADGIYTDGIKIKTVKGGDLGESGGKILLIGTEIDYSKLSVPWVGETEYNLFLFNTVAYLEPYSSSLNSFNVHWDVPGNIISVEYDLNTLKTILIISDSGVEKIILLNEYFENIVDVNIESINNSDVSFSIIKAVISSDYNNSKKLFLADSKRGLVVTQHNNKEIDFLESMAPNGPAGINIGSLSSSGENIMFTHGAKITSWNNSYNYQEISLFNNYTWSQSSTLIELGIYDAVEVIGSKIDPPKFFVGTWNSGLLEFNGNSLMNKYNEKNSSLQTITSSGWIRIGGIDFDNNNNLWVTNSQAENPLSKLSVGGVWTSFSVPGLPTSIMSGKILCVSNGQKWIQLRNEGLIVAQEENKEIISKKIGTMDGLPSQTVNCFVEDSEGAVWVGTSQGLCVFYSPNEIFNNSDYSGEYILIETEDGYVEKLFENTEILDMKVDGANRKWVATKANGVFLVTPNGTSQIYHFTKENSPLIHNTVYEISVLGSSGEVFFATEGGVCSYRSNSTDSNNNFENVIVFPNPVRRDYRNDIAISGLTNDTNVKITDISGNLVFETNSLGGTATWDGKGFNGERVSTGVYLFLCTDANFEESIVKKVLIYN